MEGSVTLQKKKKKTSKKERAPSNIFYQKKSHALIITLSGKRFQSRKKGMERGRSDAKKSDLLRFSKTKEGEICSKGRGEAQRESAGKKG